MLRFVNNSPLQGADAIKAFFTSWLANLDVIEHEIVAFGSSPILSNSNKAQLTTLFVSVDVVGDKVYQEVTVSYVVKGDETREKFTIPGMAVMHRTSDGKKVRQFDVYLNPSDVVKRMGDVASKNL